MLGNNELHAMRLRMETTQSAMAEKMGVPLRTYEDLEAGRTAIRPVHLNAARYACLRLAAAFDGFQARLPDDVVELVTEAGFQRASA